MGKGKYTDRNNIGKWDLEADATGGLIVGGCNTIELSELYGTPLHIVNEGRLKRTANHLLKL